MNVIRISALAGVVVLVGAGFATAQTTAPDQNVPPSQRAISMSPGMAPASPDSAMSPAMVVAGSPGTSPSQVDALRQGDNRTVTNGPVPDTPANRARFGKPMSHAGKKTPPSGN